MSQTLCPYLSFGTNAAEAMTFYQSVFGGEVMTSTFGQFGTEGPDADLVMHSQLVTDTGFTLMGADTPSFMERKPAGGFVISLSGDDADDLKGYWAKLSEGATISTPLEKQMWGDEYGSLTDKFGVEWLINVASGDSGEAGESAD